MDLLTYYIIGLLINLYMYWFYYVKQKQVITYDDVIKVTIGPLIWPLLIIKHLYDVFIKKSVKY